MADPLNPYSEQAAVSSDLQRSLPATVIDADESASVAILAIISGAFAAIATAFGVFLAGGLLMRLLGFNNGYVSVGIALTSGICVGILVGMRTHRQSTENPANWVRDYDPLP